MGYDSRSRVAEGFPNVYVRQTLAVHRIHELMDRVRMGASVAAEVRYEGLWKPLVMRG